MRRYGTGNYHGEVSTRIQGAALPQYHMTLRT